MVLLIDHEEEGSFGFVINKASAVDFPRVLAELDLDDERMLRPSIPVFQGGPVSPETGWVVFDPRDAPAMPDDTLMVHEGLALTASLEMLQHIAGDRAPSRVFLSLGYAGWSDGQLEDELREGSWIPVDLNLELLYELPMEERWEFALRAQGVDPAWLVTRGAARA